MFYLSSSLKISSLNNNSFVKIYFYHLIHESNLKIINSINKILIQIYLKHVSEVSDQALIKSSPNRQWL